MSGELILITSAKMKMMLSINFVFLQVIPNYQPYYLMSLALKFAYSGFFPTILTSSTKLQNLQNIISSNFVCPIWVLQINFFE